MNAIILAGGKGSRLQPWPAPKCLLPVGGVPILHRLLRQFADTALVKRTIVCVGYRAKDIAESARLNAVSEAAMLSDAGEDAPMGARLLEARRAHLQLDTDRTLICYGDELADVGIKSLVAKHESERRLMTVTACKQRVIGGVVFGEEVDNIRIRDDWQELVNIGFVVVEPECWSLLQPEHGLSDWINAVSASDMQAERAGGLKRVGVYRHLGKRATINSLADLKAAEEMWR